MFKYRAFMCEVILEIKKSNLAPTNSSHSGKGFHLCTSSKGPISSVKASDSVVTELPKRGPTPDMLKIFLC